MREWISNEIEFKCKYTAKMALCVSLPHMLVGLLAN